MKPHYVTVSSRLPRAPPTPRFDPLGSVCNCLPHPTPNKKPHAIYRNTVLRDTPNALAISAVDSPRRASFWARFGLALVDPGFRPRVDTPLPCNVNPCPLTVTDMLSFNLSQAEHYRCNQPPHGTREVNLLGHCHHADPTFRPVVKEIDSITEAP